jgi:cytoskeleton protein RodZ
MSAEWAEQPAGPGSHGAPGRTLAAQREAMGWTVEQVADQLKLAVRQVIALEAGDYAALPGPAVVRGFVRAYAKVVKLDPTPLVAMIALDTPAPSDATSTTVRRDKPASFSEVRFPTNGKRAALPLGWIGAAIVVGAAAAAAWHFGVIPGTMLRSDAATTSGAAASVTVLPPPATGADGQIETTLVKPGEESKALQSPSVPLISVPPPSSGAAPDGVAPAPAATGNALVLDVREDSWIEVRRSNGAPLISRLVKGGSSETFDITEPVTLVVGKPSAVAATLRGAAVELPAVAGSSVSRVNLK